MKELGELLYEGSFNLEVSHKNDRNEHLNNADYFQYCEYVRAEFLKQFGWSDAFFRKEKNIAYTRRRFFDLTYRRSLKYGDNFKVDLKITKIKNPFFQMDFQFFNDSQELVFTAQTQDLFVDVSKEEPISIPSFFLEALKKRLKI
ncbi:acyl-CoA thioesterase [Candidatus Pacearchaeota archaeon]|nr:acyl-CoA thioesterase [Candidatus Pacearchaeota archaeon]